MNRHEDEKSRLLQELQVAEAPVPVGSMNGTRW